MGRRRRKARNDYHDQAVSWACEVARHPFYLDAALADYLYLKSYGRRNHMGFATPTWLWYNEHHQGIRHADLSCSPVKSGRAAGTCVRSISRSAYKPSTRAEWISKQICRRRACTSVLAHHTPRQTYSRETFRQIAEPDLRIGKAACFRSMFPTPSFRIRACNSLTVEPAVAPLQPSALGHESWRNLPRGSSPDSSSPWGVDGGVLQREPRYFC